MPVNQVTSTASGATGLPISSLTGMLQGGLGSILSMGENLLDKILPPATRENMKQKLIRFASEKPYLASFLLSQIALSGLPLALFIIMTISIAIFALIAGLLVGLLGAILFILGAVGFALLFLLPVLFFTTFAAVAVWLWGMGAYKIIKAFNEKKVPGIHVPMGDGLKRATGLDNLAPELNGQQTQQSERKPQSQTQTNGTIEKDKQRPKKLSTSSTKGLGDNPVEKVTTVPKDLTEQVPGKPVHQVDSTVSGLTNSIGI